jgi:DHA2 family multidrug resistance protein
MAGSLWLMGTLNLEADFFSIALPRILQGFGIGLFFVPLTASTYVNIPKEEMGNASGVFNLLRNLGGSFGVAAGTTLLTQRTQFHQNFLVEHITPYNPALREYAGRLAQAVPNLSASGGQTAFLAAVYREVLRQANMLAFNDVFHLFAWATAILVPLTLFMRRRRRGTVPGAMAVH